MANVDIEFTDNSEIIAKKIKAAIHRALVRIGMQAERFAKEKCPVDTGRLRNSITNKVKDDAAYVGTNVEYGAQN